MSQLLLRIRPLFTLVYIKKKHNRPYKAKAKKGTKIIDIAMFAVQLIGLEGGGDVGPESSFKCDSGDTGVISARNCIIVSLHKPVTS